MSRFRKGQRVLATAVVQSEELDGWIVCGGLDGSGDHTWTDEVQADPGVPIADLLEELELRTQVMERYPDHWQETSQWGLRIKIKMLRNAREAMQGPRFEAGEEVWVRAHVDRDELQSSPGYVSCSVSRVAGQCYIPPEDIRREPPTDD